MAWDTGSAATRCNIFSIDGMAGAFSSRSRQPCTSAPSCIREIITFRASATFGVVNTRGDPKRRE
eukprot:8469196-Pyramimonas_sp.AAC.1